MSGANGRLKINLGGEWVNCDFGVIGLGPIHYLRIYNKQAHISIGGRREHLSHALRAAADLIDGIPPQPLVTETAGSDMQSEPNLVTRPEAEARQAVTNPTPAEVIEHFRNSPDLASMADDVAAALAGHVSQGDQVRQDLRTVLDQIDIDELIDDQGNSKYGAQAKVAVALGIPNAGSYRSRILTILQQIARSKTTTTGENPTNHKKTA